MGGKKEEQQSGKTVWWEGGGRNVPANVVSQFQKFGSAGSDFTSGARGV